MPLIRRSSVRAPALAEQSHVCGPLGVAHLPPAPRALQARARLHGQQDGQSQTEFPQWD